MQRQMSMGVSCETDASKAAREGAMIYPIRWDLYHVIRSQRLCLRCGICVQVCPYGVHLFIEESVISIDADCMGCGLCERQCPAGAIKIRLTDAQYETDRHDHPGLAFMPVERLAL